MVPADTPLALKPAPATLTLEMVTFSVPAFSSEVSTVEIKLAHLGEGCELKLINSGVPREWAEKTREGWAGILLKARDVLAG